MKIVYKTMDGKEFDNKDDAMKHEEILPIEHVIFYEAKVGSSSFKYSFKDTIEGGRQECTLNIFAVLDFVKNYKRLIKKYIDYLDENS